jgi:hypothetical protein
MQSANGFLRFATFPPILNTCLEIANTYKVCLRQVLDCILIEDALVGWYTNSDMQAINRCRLYLHAECLSDICTGPAVGLRIDPRLQAQSPNVTLQSITKKWQCQGLPGRRSCGQYCADSLSRSCASSTTWLHQMLGPWAPAGLRT